MKKCSPPRNLLLLAAVAGHGLTATEAARRASVSRASFSNWVHLRRKPRPALRAAVARALGMPEASLGFDSYAYRGRE